MIRRLALALFVIVLIGCGADPEPAIVPPRPEFADASIPPNPVDSRIYADVDPTLDAIVIEWKADTTHNTTGYDLYRSNDSTVGEDGLLLDRLTIAHFETANELLDPLPTDFRDTVGIQVGGTFYYQLRPFYKSPTNRVTYGPPSVVDLSTSFRYKPRVNLISPSGLVTQPGTGMKFLWQDPEDGGSYQIIVQSATTNEYYWSARLQEFSNIIAVEYPLSAKPLTPGSYRWRVKRIGSYSGSSSSWMTFTIVP